VFQAAAWLISFFYDLLNSYALAIAAVAVAVMILITPLTLKSTKGMLEMQRLQPEMRRIQQECRGDRQRLNEEMMKLYSEHKVNPLASCLPLLAQMPIFIIMFRVLSKLTEKSAGESTFSPSYLAEDSQLYQDLSVAEEMRSFGLDLAVVPARLLGDDFVRGIPYVLLVLVLAGLYYIQQKMVASRTVSPSMSPTQQKIMQYLPVFFAVFQLFFPTGLVVYYIAQALFRIGQQAYITRRFYRGEGSIGQQAQAASARARDMAKEAGGKGASPSKGDSRSKPSTPPKQGRNEATRRTTPPKGRATPPSRSGGSGRHPKPNQQKPPRS